jgi:hypothetical protein
MGHMLTTVIVVFAAEFFFSLMVEWFLIDVSHGHPHADAASGGDLAEFYRSGPNFTEVGYGCSLRNGWRYWR